MVRTKPIMIVVASSMLMSFLSFQVLQPVVASSLTQETSLELFTLNSDNQLEAYEEEINGFTQIGIRWGSNTTIITDDRFAHTNPRVAGNLVTWSAQKGSQWQIFVFDALTNLTTQLTFRGNNVNPQMSDSLIAWEGQVDNNWGIFIHKGGKTSQISDSQMLAQDLQVHRDQVAFSQKDPNNGWHINLYDATTNKQKVIAKTTNGYKPEFVGEKLRWKIPLYENGVAYGEMDLTTDKVVYADSEEEFSILDTTSFADPQVIKRVKQKLGRIENLPLPETLQVLGIIDERGRVIE